MGMCGPEEDQPVRPPPVETLVALFYTARGIAVDEDVVPPLPGRALNGSGEPVHVEVVPLAVSESAVEGEDERPSLLERAHEEIRRVGVLLGDLLDPPLNGVRDPPLRRLPRQHQRSRA